jgi:hypothetical protein
MSECGSSGGGVQRKSARTAATRWFDAWNGRAKARRARRPGPGRTNGGGSSAAAPCKARARRRAEREPTTAAAAIGLGSCGAARAPRHGKHAGWPPPRTRPAAETRSARSSSRQNPERALVRPASLARSLARDAPCSRGCGRGATSAQACGRPSSGPPRRSRASRPASCSSPSASCAAVRPARGGREAAGKSCVCRAQNNESASVFGHASVRFFAGGPPAAACC